MPEITPDNNGAPLAKATPKHSGNATKKTTTLAGKSFLILENIATFINSNTQKFLQNKDKFFIISIISSNNPKKGVLMKMKFCKNGGTHLELQD